MKILLLNPNTTEAMTLQMAEVAQRVAAADTVLAPLTAPRGVAYIASRAEAQIAGAIVLEMIAEHGSDADAVIVAAFGDPGLEAARELFDVPVIGMAQAAIIAASVIAERFAIVTFSAELTRWYEDCVERNGAARRCTGIIVPDGPAGPVDGVADRLGAAILQEARAAAANGADAVILAGAPLAGLASRLEGKLRAPLIDPITCAVLLAELTVRLGARRFPCPSHGQAKPVVGLPGSLAAALANGSADGRGD